MITLLAYWHSGATIRYLHQQSLPVFQNLATKCLAMEHSTLSSLKSGYMRRHWSLQAPLLLLSNYFPILQLPVVPLVLRSAPSFQLFQPGMSLSCSKYRVFLSFCPYCVAPPTQGPVGLLAGSSSLGPAWAGTSNLKRGGLVIYKTIAFRG